MRALFLITLAASLCPGQAADEGKPAATNVKGAEYPKVVGITHDHSTHKYLIPSGVT